MKNSLSVSGFYFYEYKDLLEKQITLIILLLLCRCFTFKKKKGYTDPTLLFTRTNWYPIKMYKKLKMTLNVLTNVFKMESDEFAMINLSIRPRLISGKIRRINLVLSFLKIRINKKHFRVPVLVFCYVG